MIIMNNTALLPTNKEPIVECSEDLVCTWTECNRLPIYVHGGYRGNSLVVYIENTQYKPKKNIVESHF